MAVILSLIDILILCMGLFTLAHQLSPATRPGLKGLIAFITCLSLISYFYYLSLVFHIGFYSLLGGIALLNVLHLRWSFPLTRRLIGTIRPALGGFLGSKIFLALSLSVLVLTVFFSLVVERWGGWDAWAIWSLHAKFLYYPNSWDHLFTNKIAFTHPDYPLMLPSVIAFWWRSIGAISPMVPALIAWVVLITIPLVVFMTLLRGKLNLVALASLGIFVASINYSYLASSQYADTLLSLFILVAFVLYREVDDTQANLIYFVGFAAASAAWIKNEGELFYAAFTFAIICFHLRTPALWLKYFVGSLLPLAVLASFKLSYAPPNDLLHSGRSESIKYLLMAAPRYWLIIKMMTLEFLKGYAIIGVLIVVALVNKLYFFRSFPFVALSTVLAGYFFVYVITPNDLAWHISSTADRILHQLFPATIFLLLNRLMDLSKPAIARSSPPL
ncbi:MAG: hypothetical protein J0H74_20800 [Chitinophagaceae bacterium]|nr:hypothetical protein [Chitinophagaceae bacterium]